MTQFIRVGVDCGVSLLFDCGVCLFDCGVNLLLLEVVGVVPVSFPPPPALLDDDNVIADWNLNT